MPPVVLLTGAGASDDTESLACDQIQFKDPYSLKYWHYALYTYWLSHFATTHDESGNEAEMHAGPDFLYRLAFQLQSPW
jgi:hypothetical protein